MNPRELTELETTRVHRIRELASELDQLGKSALDKAAEAGHLLTECKAGLDHGAWLPWLEENFTFTDRTAQRWMKLAEDMATGKLKNDTVSDLGLTEAYRLLSDSAAPTEDTEDTDPDPLVVDGIKAETPDQTPRPHVSQNSGENEWFTPPEFIASAVVVMGGIDLDPASCTAANKTVGAKRIHTKEKDGLEHNWKGRVWMNPPYAQPLCEKFCAKLCASLTTGVSQAIVLVNNATETQWFQRMAALSTAICFPKLRTKFLDPQGKLGAPLQGQAILYFGLHAAKFKAEFAQYGLILIPDRKEIAV